MRVYWLVVAILLLTYSVFYGVRYMTLPTPPKQIGDEEMRLSISKQVGSTEDLKNAWSNTPGGTLLFHINPIILNRTATIGNEYATLVDIGRKQRLKFLISPDAGRSLMMAPAILEIYVTGDTYPEIVDIPGLYLQRWSCVAIVKQGRKFNIYVNGRLQASHTCLSMPEYDNDKPIYIGDTSGHMGGKIAHINLLSYAMTMDDVRNYISENAATDGKPYLESDAPILPDFSLEGILDIITCPGGGCNKSKNIGPLDKWNSEYA